MLRFSDGICINTRGHLRPLKLRDGWYVVGGGTLLPVDSLEEATEVIQKMKGIGK